jgi:hypothetical protein
MHTRLLVPHQDVREIGVVLQGFSDTRDVSVAEDSQDACEKGILLSIPFHVLVLEKGNDGLCRGQPSRAAHESLLVAIKPVRFSPTLRLLSGGSAGRPSPISCQDLAA